MKLTNTTNHQLLLLPGSFEKAEATAAEEEVIVTIRKTFGKKRKRNEPIARSPCATPPPAAAATTPTLLSPVAYLESLLSTAANTDDCSNNNNKRRRISRDAPGVATAGYDMESVTAIRAKDLTKLRAMRAAGKSFDACNSNGESLLHLACRRADAETVRFLVEEAVVDCDVRDGMGRTVLHDACWRHTPDENLMAVLLKRVDPALFLAKDARGHTPFDYARKQHWPTWAAFLQRHRERIILAPFRA